MNCLVRTLSSALPPRVKNNSLNFIRLLRVVITPSVTSLLRGENNSKQSDEFQANAFFCSNKFAKMLAA